MEQTVEYKCEACHNIVDLEITIYSHDEYFMDDICPECGEKIPMDVQDKILNGEVTDYVGTMVDRAHDLMGDR